MRHAIVTLLLIAASFAQQLPDAPSATKQQQTPAPSTTTPPPSQPRYTSSISWRETFDKKFIAVHVLFAASVFWDERVTITGEHKGCALEGNTGVPRYVTYSDLGSHDWPIFFGVTAMDMAFKKLGLPIAWTSGAAFGTAKHLRGVGRWMEVCH